MIVAGLDFSRDIDVRWPTILTNEQEMGDSANRCGSFYTCAAVLEGTQKHAINYITTMDLLECEPGIWRRSPDISKWYSSEKNFSRDQINNVLCAIIAFKDYARGARTASKYQSRWFFSQNTYRNWCWPGEKDCGPKISDPPTPALFSLLARASNAWWLWPLMWITDLGLLVDVWMCNRDKHDIPVQLCPALIAANIKWQTVWSRLALKNLDMTHAEQLLLDYFRYGKNGIQNMTPLYLKALRKAYNDTIKL